MYPRRLAKTVVERLAQFPAVAILGPRQVGKTTLTRMLKEAQQEREWLYLDLENPIDSAKLEDAPSYLRANANKTIIIDEVQREPGIYQILRGIIDERIAAGEPAGHFLLLGSASVELLAQSSETLAGRIAYLELLPLDILEVNAADAKNLWLRGGFPRSLLARSDEQSAIWRANFIATYLERDIPLLGPRIPAETLRRFWTMLAHRQGSLLNASDLARSLGVSNNTITTYLDLMVDLLLVRRLQPLHANIQKRLVKSPKVYIRDTGLVHSLLGIESMDALFGHPVVGGSWEGHVIETLIGVAPPRTQATFFRTTAGAEMDLVLDMPNGRRWAFEVKRGSVVSLSKGFHHAREDLAPQRCFVIYGGDERYPKGPGVEVMGLKEAAAILAGAE